MAPQIGLWAILWDIFFSLFWRKKKHFFFILSIGHLHSSLPFLLFYFPCVSVFIFTFLSTVFLTLFCSVLVLFFSLFFPVSPSSEVPNYVLSSCLLSNHQLVQLLKLNRTEGLALSPSNSDTSGCSHQGHFLSSWNRILCQCPRLLPKHQAEGLFCTILGLQKNPCLLACSLSTFCLRILHLPEDISFFLDTLFDEIPSQRSVVVSASATCPKTFLFSPNL